MRNFDILSSCKQHQYNRVNSGAGTNMKVWGTCPAQAPEIFFILPLHFLALQIQLVVLVSAFMMVSTVWSVSSLLSHTRTVVRECFKGDEASQWKRPKFDPSPHQNRSSQKLAGVITSWTAPGMQNFVAIGSGVSVLQIRDFAVLLG